jgi:hypothetical protein
MVGPGEYDTEFKIKKRQRVYIYIQYIYNIFK